MLKKKNIKLIWLNALKFAKEGTIIKLPEPNEETGKIPSTKFTKFKNKLERPYIVYADMESTLVQTDHKKTIHELVPNSCWFYFVCTYDSTQNVLWHDVSISCVENMIKELNKLAFICINKAKHNEEMVMNERGKLKDENQIKCHICHKYFRPDDIKCRDHDHRTNKFREMPHQKCNINY